MTYIVSGGALNSAHSLTVKIVPEMPRLGRETGLTALLSQGWKFVAASDMNYFYAAVVSPDERFRVECLEPFDEFEEWHLKCAHYVLITALGGRCFDLTEALWPSSFAANGAGNVDDGCGTFVRRSKTCLPACGDVEVARSGVCLADECTWDLGEVSSSRSVLTDAQSGLDNSLRTMDEGCGTVACSNETRVPTSKVVGLAGPHGGVAGTRSFDSSWLSSSEMEQQDHLVDAQARLPPSDERGSHWKVAEWTFIGDKTDTEGVRRFGHSANKLTIGGQRHLVSVGGFGVASCGQHRRLANVTGWNMASLAAPETFEVDSDWLLLARTCHAAATLGSSSPGNSRLVVVGGRRSPKSPAREQVVVVDFDEAFSTRSVRCHEVSRSGDVPEPCWRHTAVHTIIDGTSFFSQPVAFCNVLNNLRSLMVTDVPDLCLICGLHVTTSWVKCPL